MTPYRYRAVVYIDIIILEDLLSGKIDFGRAVHGVRNIKIRSVRGGFNSYGTQCLILEITSPDVPAYVAYQRIFGNVKNDYQTGLPVVDLIFSTEKDED